MNAGWRLSQIAPGSSLVSPHRNCSQLPAIKNDTKNHTKDIQVITISVNFNFHDRRDLFTSFCIKKHDKCIFRKHKKHQKDDKSEISATFKPRSNCWHIYTLQMEVGLSF